MAFRIAVIGIGKIARDQHLPCIAKNKNFKLVLKQSLNW
jgi:D-galactose 1-dehydrogenase